MLAAALGSEAADWRGEFLDLDLTAGDPFAEEPSSAAAAFLEASLELFLPPSLLSTRILQMTREGSKSGLVPSHERQLLRDIPNVQALGYSWH